MSGSTTNGFRSTGFIAMVMLLCGANSLVAAQKGAGTITSSIEAIEVRGFVLSARAGAGLPRGSFDNDVDPGMSAKLGLEYLISSIISAEAVLGYHHFSDGGLGSDLKIYQLSLNARYYPIGGGRFRPFANSGGGMYILDPGDTRYGFNVGAGLQFDLTPQLSLEPAIGYHRVQSNNVEPEFLTVQAGLRYRF